MSTQESQVSYESKTEVTLKCSRTSMALTPLEPWKYVQDRGTLMCLSIGTPKNNKFSICSKWKIHYF